MLELKNVVKTYKTGNLILDALNDVSISFRENEFVAILGHSGSGKTTMLNIVGGLDQYTSGDLIINGISTKDYKDRDWDIYRNYSIGFVFQNYNLIPHQSVLSNVELALTLSGVGAKERKQRAIDALTQVGLVDHIYKKPNQLSGGQMQRVAIARALINNPTILLADEPTGALDSDTSVQVMALLKEIAKEKLVIMVTHNPELANEYANRIVKLVDGKIVSDSNVFNITKEVIVQDNKKRLKANSSRSMSLMTAFSLSLNNLLTKKSRTIMTSFAGSIGIMGIALILSVSSGFQTYIDKMQEDTLSTYPLTIEAKSFNFLTLISNGSPHGDGSTNQTKDINERPRISELFAQMRTSIGTNNISAFKEHYEKNETTMGKNINAIKYGYDLQPQIYALNKPDKIVMVNPNKLFPSSMSGSIGMFGNNDVFNEMIDNRQLIESQYDMLAGRWPENFQDLLLVLPKKGVLNDYVSYALGLRDQKEFTDAITKISKGENVELDNQPLAWNYQDFLDLSFSLVSSADYYRYNNEYQTWEDMSDDETFMLDLISKGEKLRIVGIVAPKEGISASALSPGIAYTSSLINHVIEVATKKEIVISQLNNKDMDIFSNRSFDDILNDKKGSKINFQDMISVDTKLLSSAFKTEVSQDYIKSLITDYSNNISTNITTNTNPATTAFTNTLKELTEGLLNKFVLENKDASGNAFLGLSMVDTLTTNYLNNDGKDSIALLSKNYVLPTSVFSNVFHSLINSMLNSYVNNYALSISSDPLTTLAPINETQIIPTVTLFLNNPIVKQSALEIGTQMTEALMRKSILTDVADLSSQLVTSVAKSFNVDKDKIAKAFTFKFNEDEIKRLMNSLTTNDKEVSFDNNLIKLGFADKTKPLSMAIYPVDFNAKENIINFIETYNNQMKADKKDDYIINYTDITGTLISSVKAIVDGISYVLIAFVAISLIVSSIMIGVITLISVLERTKEIGILRALGASKKDIARVFNAETVIIGLCSGIIGIVTTLLLLIPINQILHKLTGIVTLNAYLPFPAAIILIIISIILTYISGLVPSSSAAKKNPVEALKSE